MKEREDQIKTDETQQGKHQIQQLYVHMQHLGPVMESYGFQQP